VMAAGQSAASGRLVDGDGGNGSVERGSGRGLSFVVPLGVQVREREDRLLEKGWGSLVPGLVLKMSENGGMVMAGLAVCGGELWPREVDVDVAAGIKNQRQRWGRGLSWLQEKKTRGEKFKPAEGGRLFAKR